MAFNQEKPQETTTPVHQAPTSISSYRVPGKLISSITSQLETHENVLATDRKRSKFLSFC